ncbi:MAG: RluA family pseudouridine synthase [Pseudohongiellaceae bacterium]
MAAEQDGQRLDNYLIRRMRGVPRSRIYRLIRQGEVRVNKKRSKPDYKLACGDEVRLPPYRGADTPIPGKPTPGLSQLLLDAVIHEDEDCLAINKPAGLSVHGGSNIPLGIIEALRQIKPEWRQAELAHRLDRDTSGVLLMARTAPALKALQAQFKAKTVNKSYLALVHGHWDAATTVVNAPLKKGELSSGERMVRVMPDGKPALTRFRIHTRYEAATLLEALPDTGRTHQIRVHCQHAGHAVVGDAKYTTPNSQQTLKRVKHLCLHAAALSFTHPASGATLELQAEPDSRFVALLETLATHTTT